jgi:hypothetical protein
MNHAGLHGGWRLIQKWRRVMLIDGRACSRRKLCELRADSSSSRASNIKVPHLATSSFVTVPRPRRGAIAPWAGRIGAGQSWKPPINHRKAITIERQ